MHDENLNRRLKQIALEAQHYYRIGDKEKYDASIGILIREIDLLIKSRQLKFPPLPSHLEGMRKDIEDEATAKLYCYISSNIMRYDPSRAEVLAWVSFKLKKTFFHEVIREFTGLKKNIDPREVSLISFDDIEEIYQSSMGQGQTLPLGEQVLRHLREDSEGIYKSTYCSGNPRANFCYIAIERNYHRRTWKELSHELGIKMQALSNFYQRKLEIFAPKIKEALSN
jgi:hypothetical protein